MKRLFPFFICLSLILSFTPITAAAAVPWPTGVSIEADGGILMDADTGSILYGKNENQAYYPASITKILTALIVLEECELDEMVTFSHDDVYNVEAGSSSAGIDEGDVLTVRDCLYALLLASANESANALACHVSGSREAFAELMNQKARSLGCTGSNFANPSGLNDENHYTTAHDMALITQEAIKNPDFVEISGTRSYQMAPTKKNAEGGYVANHHNMVKQNTSVTYPGAFAGKTGYTSLAGNTLVTCAERDGITLIAVVLNGHQSHYRDTKALFDFGFSNFQSLKAADHETTYRSLENDMTIAGMTAKDSISLSLDPDSRVILPREAVFSDLTPSLSYELGQDAPKHAIARISYTYEGHETGQVYLCTTAQVNRISAPDTVISSDAALSESSDAANLSTTPSKASVPSETESPDPVLQIQRRSAQPDAAGTEDKGTLFGLPLWLAVSLSGGFAVILGAGIFLFLHNRQKEQEDLMRRRQRRLERLEDMGFSSSDFDQMLSKKRSSIPSYRPRRRTKGRSFRKNRRR